MFRENNIEAERVNYFNEPLTAEKLHELIQRTGLTAFEVLRRGEKAFKESNFTRETPEDEIIAAIVENPNLLQRPLVEVGKRAVLARPIEKALEIVK